MLLSRNPALFSRFAARCASTARAPPLLPAATAEGLISSYGVAGFSVAVIQPGHSGTDSLVRTLVAGVADKAASPPTPVYDSTWFEIASLSKPIAAAYAFKYFAKHGIPMDAKVNPLLAEAGYQAANDGFRGVLLVCFDGPDAARGPRGLVAICNGDNQGMLLNCALSRALLTSDAAFSPPLQNVDWSRVPSMEDGFSTEGMKQEEIVNLGLRELVLNAFD
jgi:hypothetical protein